MVVIQSMYIVYAIHNKNADKIYIGQTEDLDERLRSHNEHLFPRAYTSRFPGSWVLIYTEQCDSRQQALQREKQLKSYRGREFIRTHIPL